MAISNEILNGLSAIIEIAMVSDDREEILADVNEIIDKIQVHPFSLFKFFMFS